MVPYKGFQIADSPDCQVDQWHANQVADQWMTPSGKVGSILFPQLCALRKTHAGEASSLVICIIGACYFHYPCISPALYHFHHCSVTYLVNLRQINISFSSLFRASASETSMLGPGRCATVTRNSSIITNSLRQKDTDGKRANRESTQPAKNGYTY